MKKVYNLQSFIIAGLRRMTYRYPPRYNAKAKAKVARNQYKCAHCLLII